MAAVVLESDLSQRLGLIVLLRSFKERYKQFLADDNNLQTN